MRFRHIAVLFAMFMTAANGADQTVTPLEFSEDLKPPGYLGTVLYQPTKRERPFYERLSEDDRITVESTDPPSKFSIKGHIGHYVSWFGLVREIGREKDGSITSLRIEQKYSQDMSDAHIQTVSIYGGGEFVVRLKSESARQKKKSR